jgi:hypothetical protein
MASGWDVEILSPPAFFDWNEASGRAWPPFLMAGSGPFRWSGKLMAHAAWPGLAAKFGLITTVQLRQLIVPTCRLQPAAVEGCPARGSCRNHNTDIIL